MTHCNYTYLTINDLIVIVDLNLGNRSVTNDIENVIKEISINLLLSDKIIVYRDSNGLYDQVLLNPRGLFERFKPITERRTVIDLFDVIKILEHREEIE